MLIIRVVIKIPHVLAMQVNYVAKTPDGKIFDNSLVKVRCVDNPTATQCSFLCLFQLRSSVRRLNQQTCGAQSPMSKRFLHS